MKPVWKVRGFLARVTLSRVLKDESDLAVGVIEAQESRLWCS